MVEQMNLCTKSGVMAQLESLALRHDEVRNRERLHCKDRARLHHWLKKHREGNDKVGEALVT